MKRLLAPLLLLSLLLPAGLLVAHSKSIVAMAADDKPSPTAVFLQYEDGFIPVTLFQNGESLIRFYDDANHSYDSFCKNTISFWQSNILNQFQAFEAELADEDFSCYALPSQEYTQALSFQQIQKQLIAPPTPEEHSKISPFVGIAANSTDPYFWADASYNHYAAAEQADVPAAYTDYVRHKLNTDGLYHTPVIIQDLWEFDFDGDGKKEAIIFASNLPSEGTEKHADRTALTALPSFKQGLGYYTYVLLYSETFLPMELVKKSFWVNQRYFLRGDEWLYKYEEPISYQFDDEGDIQAFRMWSIYDDCSINRPPFLRTVICDFDQDGRYDFGIFYGIQNLYKSRSYPSEYQIYLQKNEHQFQYFSRCSIYTEY